MTKEIAVARNIQILRPENGPVIAQNVIHIDFQNKARIERNKIVPISGSIPELTVVSSEKIPAQIIKLFPSSVEISVIPEKPETSPIKVVEKSESYHPGRRQEGYITETSKRIRRSGRGSRCFRPGHDPETCHRKNYCRGRGRVAVLQMSKKRTRNKESQTKAPQIKDSAAKGLEKKRKRANKQRLDL